MVGFSPCPDAPLATRSALATFSTRGSRQHAVVVVFCAALGERAEVGDLRGLATTGASYNKMVSIAASVA